MESEDHVSHGRSGFVTATCVLGAFLMTGGAAWHSLAPAASVGTPATDRRDTKNAKAPVAETQVKAEPAPRPVTRTAQFTCRMMGSLVQVSMCFVGGASQGAAGSLAIRNGSATRQYTTYEIMAEFSAPNGRVMMPLPDDFAIAAQANGSDYSVLHLDILEDGQVVASREASRYGVISVRS